MLIKEKVKMKIVHKKGKMLTTKEFVELSGISEASATRLKNELKKDFTTRGLIYKNGSNVYIDRKVLGKVASRHLFECDRRLFPEYYQENNTLREYYISLLKEIPWDIFGSVSYAKTLSSNACSDRMRKLEEQIKAKYPTSIVTLFFINEFNTCERGYHTHFVLRVSPQGSITELKSFVENKLRGVKNTANTLLKTYDPGENGIEYIMKYFNNNRDGYDFLDNSGASEQFEELNKAA